MSTFLSTSSLLTTTWQRPVQGSLRPHRGTLVRAAAEPIVSSEAPVGLAFGEALSRAWQKDPEPLRQLLSADVTVDTPVWECDSLVSYLDSLSEATEFLSPDERPPALLVLSQRELEPGVARVEWVLNADWPSMWRARINLLGESVVRFRYDGERALVRDVRETWHETPMQVFMRQIMPRRRDWMSLWNAPTAEHLPQKVERVCRDYELRRLPPMLAVLAETVETGEETILEEQAPLAPSFAFTGQVKRAEWYSTVSPNLLERSFTTVALPGNMEQPAQRRRWVLPLPTRFALDPDALPDPDGGVDTPLYAPGVQQKSIQYVRRPAQRLAVAKVRGLPSNENVLRAVRETAAAARRDGLRVATQGGRPVFIHLCYDVKNGFNARGQLSMAVWVAQPESLQENEVGVVLEADEDDE